MTDPDTAKYLEDLQSPAATLFPGSPIEAISQVRTDFSLAEAVRISVTDPNLVPVFKKDGRSYLGGSINIDPINVAKRLAKTVIGRYPGLYSSDIEQPGILSSFGFDGNRVRKRMLQEKADYWVDATTSDFESFSPTLKMFSLVSGVPESYDDYVKIVEVQYQAGVNRAKEALAGEQHSTRHIRKPITKR